jgi:hypothetical protein
MTPVEQMREAAAVECESRADPLRAKLSRKDPLIRSSEYGEPHDIYKLIRRYMTLAAAIRALPVADDPRDAEIARLRAALELAQSALDRLMGDTDPLNETYELRAMRTISAALAGSGT